MMPHYFKTLIASENGSEAFKQGIKREDGPW